MKKLIALLLAAVMVFGMTAALADDSDLAYVQGKGTLVVGITDFAPMDYKDDNGSWIGIDADLAAKFAESLGVSVEFVEIDWDNKILELNAKSIDCVWNGMTLTDEVTSSMSCTDAYMSNAQVVVLKNDDMDAMPETATAADLAGKVFAVEAGSAGEAIAVELGLQYTSVSSQANALMEVAAGTSDGAIIDQLMAMAMVGEGTGYDTLSWGFPLNEESYGVGFRTGSDLAEAANTFLAEEASNGDMDALVTKYLAQ